jgi:hypothetical protein
MEKHRNDTDGRVEELESRNARLVAAGDAVRNYLEACSRSSLAQQKCYEWDAAKADHICQASEMIADTAILDWLLKTLMRHDVAGLSAMLETDGDRPILDRKSIAKAMSEGGGK